MASKGEQYVKDGVTAAKFSVLFPGLGQLLNKHYLKGMLVIGVASFIMALHFMLLAQPSPYNKVAWSAALLAGLFTVWQLSVFDAYYSAVKNRRADAKRRNVQILTMVRGVDTSRSSFQEVAVTRNLSKFGACLIMSTEVEPNSQLTLTFEGKPKGSQARVVWARETGNRDERTVGVELIAPLREP
jgi:PilZ domain